MPRSPLHALIWSSNHSLYEFHTHGHLEQRFKTEDEEAWLTWLAAQTSFAFQGRSGRLNVHKEARPRGGEYWYAYHKSKNSTRKRYLGQTGNVTFARLEQEAKALEAEPLSTPLAPSLPLHEVEQGMVLPVTRLSRPLLPSTLVARERLLIRLDAACSHRLTLLSASAGWGKTTLLSEWAARSSFPIAWLSLDELDNDPTRFWASVLAALRTCLPGVGEIALAMLASPQPPGLTTILTTLVNELSALAEPIVLLLDDYHLIEEQAIHDALLFLLEYLPTHLHLVLASRVDPLLALSRLRVRGHLLELRDADLRFREDEANSFLTHTMDLSLSEAEVAELAKRTEGWIAGLQLAALSMQHREDLSTFVRGFTGSHRYVLDYVQEEILACLSETLQHFLLQIAILNRMSASLCQAVTSEEESAALLERAERANLFLIPLDEERRWYRMHDLFREVLLARLHATRPEMAPLLHQRAASWYEAQGEWREAITHALAAADYPFAASLMERAAEQFWLSGEAMTVHSWVLALPDAVLSKYARIALNAALRLLNSVHVSMEELHARTQAQVERTIARMEGILHGQQIQALSAAEVALIGRRLRLLRALIEARAILKRGNKERLRILLQELEQLPQDEEVIWDMILLSFIFWQTSTLGGEGALLVSGLLEAKQRMLQAVDHLATIRVMTWLVLAYLQAGQLHLVHQECLEGLALVEQISGRTAMAGYLYHALFIVDYIWNRLDEASGWLHRLLRIAHDWHQVELLGMGEQAQVHLSLATGDLAAAQLALHKMEALIEHEGFSNHADWLVRSQVRYWLAQGNLQEASNWAAQTRLHLDAWDPLRKTELLMLVRVYLALQQYPQAIELLESFSTYLDRPGDILATIEFLVLSLVTLYGAGKREQAQAIAARLFSMTEPEGYIRMYLNEGEPMKRALQSFLDAPQDVISRSYVSMLLAAFEQEERRSASMVDAQSACPQEVRPQTLPLPQSAPPAIKGLAAEKAAPILLESLSPQEQRVLRLLIVGQTYTGMAETLIVSRNTIKTQVSSIYRKLGVNSRAEAMALAHRLFLL